MNTQIPMEALVVGRHYVGRGRNGNVGQWNGRCFLVIGEKFGDPMVKQEPYYTQESGCFQPFRLVDEGRTIEPVGLATPWEQHYASVIEFADHPIAAQGGGRGENRGGIERV